MTRPITSTKGRKFPPETYTKGEVFALIEGLSSTSASGIRNRALLWLLYRTGLRITEALDLRLQDLDRPKVTVALGKGGKTRTVAMSPDAWAALDLWLARRKAKAVPAGSPVFCTLRGGWIGHGYIRQMLERAKAKGGVEKRVHAHAFRHTFASELAEEGVDLVVIQRALGHASLSQTATYLARLGHVPRVVDALVDRPGLAA